MGFRSIRAAAAIELGLVILQYTFDISWLPLGGSHPAQIGIVLGTAFVLTELKDVFKGPPTG